MITLMTQKINTDLRSAIAVMDQKPVLGPHRHRCHDNYDYGDMVEVPLAGLFFAQ